jgi:alpha-L-fucosidase 2
MLLLSVMWASAAAAAEPSAANNERLWYRHPGKEWNSQALHLGNGYFGASFFGDVKEEVFTLGEKTFWTGGPGDATGNSYGMKPVGGDHLAQLAEIRRLILAGKIPEADKLYDQTMLGDYKQFGGLSTVGSLRLDLKDHEGEALNYLRQIDLRRAIASVSYELGGVCYHREYFCSYPARALVIRLTASKPAALSFGVRVDPAHKNHQIRISPERGMWELSGTIDGNNRPYRVKIRVFNDGGTLSANGQRLEVKGAHAATVIYTVATDYMPKPPLYRGADPETVTAGVIHRLEDRDYASIRHEHVADYQKLYLRTEFHLNGGKTDRKLLPTDERWRFYLQHDYADSGLQELAFNVGKYLLISASRPGALPSGLQGPWSCHYLAPWSGNYQININIPLVYMPGNALGLSECNEPFLRWIEALVVPGREVARTYYGTGGWVGHGTGNIWGYAAPGSVIEWGAFPCGAAWECRHLWEQYEFSQDKAALRERFYPVMKEAAQFWLENLVEYKGHLIAIPAVSAEQRSPKGFLLPPMQDVILVRDLFDNTMAASKVLGEDDDFRGKLAKARDKLMPLKVGRLGQLQEWVEDVDDPNCHHRHFMHLLSVQPCQQIDPRKDKALAEAARVSMNLRGDGNNAQRLDPRYQDTKCSCLHHDAPADLWIGGNWSRAWKCWIWARLLDGDRADKILSEMLGEAGMENLCTYQQVPPGRTPMQLDGSISTPGIMAEMLLQSHHDEIELLPALTKSWSSGSVSGLRARGGFVVDITWEDGNLSGYRIRSAEPREVNVRIGGHVRCVKAEKLR